MEKYGIARQARDDNIVRRMNFACWITKATGTHSECVILTDFLRQKWLSECTSTLCLCIHCLYCLKGEHLLSETERILFLLAKQVKGTKT